MDKPEIALHIQLLEPGRSTPHAPAPDSFNLCLYLAI